MIPSSQCEGATVTVRSQKIKKKRCRLSWFYSADETKWTLRVQTWTLNRGRMRETILKNDFVNSGGSVREHLSPPRLTSWAHRLLGKPVFGRGHFLLVPLSFGMGPFETSKGSWHPSTFLGTQTWDVTVKKAIVVVSMPLDENFTELSPNYRDISNTQKIRVSQTLMGAFWSILIDGTCFWMYSIEKKILKERIKDFIWCQGEASRVLISIKAGWTVLVHHDVA